MLGMRYKAKLLYWSNMVAYLNRKIMYVQPHSVMLDCNVLPLSVCQFGASPRLPRGRPPDDLCAAEAAAGPLHGLGLVYVPGRLQPANQQVQPRGSAHGHRNTGEVSQLCCYGICHKPACTWEEEGDILGGGMLRPIILPSSVPFLSPPLP